MTRRKPSSSVSPQQLKAVAVGTVLMVGLLAMVAGGQDAGIAAQAQTQARKAKDDLIATEQKNLGTRKIVAGLRVDSGGYGGFGEDGGGYDGGFAVSGGGGSSRPALQPPPGANAPSSESLANLKPGQKIVRQRPPKRPGEEGSEHEEGARSGPSENGRTGSGGPHDTSQVAAAIEASRQRSGSSNANGD